MSGGWCFSITLNPVLPWSLPESGYWPLVSRGWADKQKIPLTWLRSNWYNEFSHSSLPFQTELHILCKIQISSTGNIQSFMDVIKPTSRIVISQVVVISATIPKIDILFFFKIKTLLSWWKKVANLQITYKRGKICSSNILQTNIMPHVFCGKPAKESFYLYLVQCMPCPQIIPFATKSFLKESIKLSGPAIAIYTELCQKVTRVAIRAIADWEKVHQKGIVGTS